MKMDVDPRYIDLVGARTLERQEKWEEDLKRRVQLVLQPCSHMRALASHRSQHPDFPCSKCVKERLEDLKIADRSKMCAELATSPFIQRFSDKYGRLAHASIQEFLEFKSVSAHHEDE